MKYKYKIYLTIAILVALANYYYYFQFRRGLRLMRTGPSFLDRYQDAEVTFQIRHATRRTPRPTPNLDLEETPLPSSTPFKIPLDNSDNSSSSSSSSNGSSKSRSGTKKDNDYRYEIDYPIFRDLQGRDILLSVEQMENKKLRERNELTPLQLTQEAQRMLYKHQHPENCQGKKFLVWELPSSGLGSDFHMTSWAFALALNTNRILVYDPRTRWIYTNGHTCPQHQRHLDCYFKFVSSCPPPPITDLVNVSKVVDIDEKHGTQRPNEAALANDKYVHLDYKQKPIGHLLSDHFGDLYMQTVPTEFFHWQPANHKAALEWWRAQSIAYLLRPSTSFRQSILNEMRKSIPQGIPRDRTIAMHVRHGDKAKEMKLHPLSDYMASALKMRNTWDKMTRLDTLFISTENDAVIRDAQQSKYTRTWKVLYTKNKRLNTSYFKSIDVLGGFAEILISMTNLFLAVQCDAWICTRASNWCRLVDEMRRVLGKPFAPYIDLEPNKMLDQA